jgi:hypothetical protein
MSAGIALVILLAGAAAVGALLKDDDGSKKKRAMAMVQLLPPPPPPKIEEQPPEPEVEEKEEVAEEEIEGPTPEEADAAPEEAPPGEQLGVDADGSAGGDAFGLVGKKGGRALIGSNPGDGAGALRRYAWYNQAVEKAVRAKLDGLLEAEKGLAGKGLAAEVELFLDADGVIQSHRIRKSSGNKEMDALLARALGMVRLDEPPPEGMPRGLRIQIQARG